MSLILLLRGGDLFVNFNDIAQLSKHGNWGVLDVDSGSSPKYDAIDFIKNLSFDGRVMDEVGLAPDFERHQVFE